MHHQPLNRDRDPVAWPPFDAGVWGDVNPSFVRITQTEAWVVFNRYKFPPQPGQASLWTARVDADMQPVGPPKLLIGQGMDARVIRMGALILVFYTIIERDPNGVISGSSVALAEFTIEGDQWTCTRNSLFPKRPIAGKASADSQQNWEKNWIPFAAGESSVGLIYSHDPWNVITLPIKADAPLQFDAAYQGPALQWDHGTIRGGTPPVRYDDAHLITFFHSSQVIGSRTVYSVGACMFRDKPPYTPVLFTASPLLIAPYKSGVHRFGWPFAMSVLFPTGVERVGQEYRLLCGRDEGEIVTFPISHSEIQARLGPIQSGPAGAIHDYRHAAGARLPLKALLYVPDPIPGIPELPMVNFLKVLAGRGRTFVDVGAHIGFYTMGLAPGFERVVSFEPSRFQYGWLKRNAGLNDYRHVSCEHVALGDQPGEAMLNVLSYEGGLNSLAQDVADQYNVIDRYAVPVETLDSRSLTDVDLLKIDVEGFEIPVLRGAVNTINASRPVILIEVWDDPVRRRDVQSVLEEMDYRFEFLFPRSPELALCLPRERSQEFAWFV
jgi:FkbM family methyltransferase